MIKILITLDSLVDTRYYLLSKIDPIYVEPKYLNSYVNRDTDMLPFIGSIFKDEYKRRHRVYAVNGLPTSIIPYIRMYIADITDKYRDSISITLNTYPYTDLLDSEKVNITNALYKLYKPSEVNVICEKATSKLYSDYNYVFDYDGLNNVLEWCNTLGKHDDLLNTTIIAPLLSEEAGDKEFDFKELSKHMNNLFIDICKFDFVPPSLFSILSVD